MQESMINQNIIITEPSKNLRALGRNALIGKWKTAIVAVCLYIVVLDLPQVIFDRLFGMSIPDMIVRGNAVSGVDAEFYSQFYGSMPEQSALSVVYMILITGALELGLALFALATFRRHQTKVTDIFLGFEKFGKALGLLLFMSLFIFLWSLLLVIPGIFASLRYSQAFFILADDPSKGIRQCMNESKAMMRGNLGKYFCMSLSFIGWGILAGLAGNVIASIGSIITTNDFVIAVFIFVGTLFVAPVIAYVYATRAGFYEILAGHLIKETEPAPVDPIEIVVPLESKAPSEETKDETSDVNTEAATEVAEETNDVVQAEEKERKKEEEKDNEQ